MLIKTLLGVGLFAAVGAAIGYSQILCFNGECPLTGSPYGGALFGGAIGLAIMGSINTSAISGQPLQADSADDAAIDEEDQHKA